MKKPEASEIFKITTTGEFENEALKVFQYQALNNLVYRTFLEKLGVDYERIQTIKEIPFLPVSFFKNHKIISGTDPATVIFESSGTTGNVTSRHYVSDQSIYKESFLGTFRLFYGEPSSYVIAGLLPSYIERENSSLVYMVNELIKLTESRLSGFYKYNYSEMLVALDKAKSEGKKVLLIGVSFALLDLAEKHPADLSGVIIMETGGMKGRRKEITREELHGILTSSLNIDVVHSEYGMTELLSQAYSKGNGIFRCPPWMKILLRDPLDPLSIYNESTKTGGINIIDLANINSCSFIATDDLGRLRDDQSFEVLGRIDNSDIRGCNLLII